MRAFLNAKRPEEIASVRAQVAQAQAALKQFASSGDSTIQAQAITKLETALSLLTLETGGML